MRYTLMILSAFLLVGCGGGTTYVTEDQAIPEIPTDTGQALIVTTTDNGTTGLSYTQVGDGSILIDCGSGGCGDVYVASPVDDSVTDTTNETTTKSYNK